MVNLDEYELTNNLPYMLGYGIFRLWSFTIANLLSLPLILSINLLNPRKSVV